MKEIKYPVSIYDEPAEYKTFSGGINTDRNDLGILPNQMKFCENMHYENGNLHVRKGGKKIAEFLCEDTFNNVQGIFLLSLKNLYVIVANNGKLYFGKYQALTKIVLTVLPIKITYSPILADTLNMSVGLSVYPKGGQPSQNHDGFLEELSQDNYNLIFQNREKIEGIQYKNKLFITTGTRFVEVSEMYSGQLFATIVSPYKPNGTEYINIGPNLLSYVPSVHIEANGTGVKTMISAVLPFREINDSIKIKAIMTYADGDSPRDYRFKWEQSSDGINYYPCSFPLTDTRTPYTSSFVNPNSIGHTEFLISKTMAQTLRFRCSFAKSFKVTYDPTKPEAERYDWQYENGDLVIDKIDGSWFGQAQSVQYNESLYTEINKNFLEIQTCKKIFGYGNKFILYNDGYNSGNFYKTVIDNPSYITYRGGLNFKTDKDEQIIKIINFKGVIVCFSYNKILGGNISIVSGNGDDYNDGSNNFSPFSRRIINKEVTTDNAETVQVTDNIIIFKYKSSLFAIEGSELNYEIVTIQEVNTHVKQPNQHVAIPWSNNNCISEKNDSYYSLIWKDTYDEDGEPITKACRVKLYYKEAFQEQGHLFFPILYDTSELFNSELIIYYDGMPVYYYMNKLISFHYEHYLDLDQRYKFKIVTRGYELNYPQFIKSIQSILVCYAHDEKSSFEWDLAIYNESMFEILKNANKEISINTTLNEDAIIKLDSLLMSYIMVSPNLREDCMSATINFSGSIDKDFAFSSFTFYYKTKSVPKIAPISKYKKIIRKGERLVK